MLALVYHRQVLHIIFPTIEQKLHLSFSSLPIFLRWYLTTSWPMNKAVIVLGSLFLRPSKDFSLIGKKIINLFCLSLFWGITLERDLLFSLPFLTRPLMWFLARIQTGSGPANVISSLITHTFPSFFYIYIYIFFFF